MANMFTRVSLLSALGILLVGIGIGYAASYYQLPPAPIKRLTDIRQSEGRLTNQLLECAELPEGLSIGNRIDLEKEIQEKIDALQAKGVLKEGAVYYRDLNNGPWFGINEEALYYPASLLKVPLAMSFYWRSEAESGILTQSVIYNGDGEDHEAAQAFGSPNRLEKGKSYTAEELITIMLQDSSNEAALHLAELAGQQNVLDVYEDFGIKEPTYGQDYQISVHTFASFFRVLFNATYLDRINSEKLLGIMTHSGFTHGITAGLPSDVLVAHKFGTRENLENGVRQLHDCGIVYAPGKPYILCVMTQGTDFDALAEFIQDVSETVFKNVTS